MHTEPSVIEMASLLETICFHTKHLRQLRALATLELVAVASASLGRAQLERTLVQAHGWRNPPSGKIVLGLGPSDRPHG